jgi:hypothetical protein
MVTALNTDKYKPEGEHREDGRHRTLRRGRILINGLHSSFEVIVRDFSEHGARLKLKLPQVWLVPNVFDLEVLSTHGEHESQYHCEKRWQEGVMVGVHFISGVPE